MRRTLKAIIVAVALIVAGSVLAGCGLWGLNGQWDLLTGSGKLVTTTETLSGDFTNIDANVFWLDVELLPSPDGTCHYKSVIHKNMPCTVTVENGTLKIDQPDNRKPHEQIGIVQGDVYLQLYLPADTYESLTFRGRTSDLEISDNFRFQNVTVENSTGDVLLQCQVEKQLNVTCSTGDVTISNVNCDSLSVSTSTGDVAISVVKGGDLSVSTRTGDCRIDYANMSGKLLLTSTTGGKFLNKVDCGSLNMTATTGETRINNVYVSADAQLTSGAGDWTLYNLVVTGDANMESSTGDWDLDNCDAANIRIETSSGDVEGTLRSEKIFFADSNTGDIEVPRTTSGGTCQITTTTGDIEIDIVP